jgi:hypothetical protein
MLKIGDKIRVNGFVMLAKLDAGDYIVSDIDSVSYSFKSNIKNKTHRCRHYKISVEAKINGNSDINYITKIN